MTQDFAQLIHHLRNRDYMSGVERERQRVKSTGEVFTPTSLVQEMLAQLPQEVFTDPHKTFLDPTCGDGQFLSEVVIAKVQHGSTYEQALSTVYGVDLMQDNCIECIKRLYGVNGDPEIQIVKGSRIPKAWRRPGVTAVFKVNGKICNIVCANGLIYDYSFGKTEMTEIQEDLVDAVSPTAKKSVTKKVTHTVFDSPLFDSM